MNVHVCFLNVAAAWNQIHKLFYAAATKVSGATQYFCKALESAAGELEFLVIKNCNNFAPCYSWI